MKRPLASLSLDLDNLWSYLRTHGDPGWEALPSYLDTVVPRVLDLLGRRGLTITFFVVGRDAAQPASRDPLRALADAGHEVGNHSFDHLPWMHRWTEAQVDGELARAEDAIEAATGARPHGFRGPGYALSEPMLRALIGRGYLYDCSTFPTFIGPAARAYYFLTAKLTAEQRAQRQDLFGGVRDGLRPNRAYRWRVDGRELVEIPVTTLPGLRVPIHLSYVLYLAQRAPAAGLAWLRAALVACRATGTEPSILLHPLDFLGRDDTRRLDFFPAMGMESGQKLEIAGAAIDLLARWFRVVPMQEHARALYTRPLRVREPDFPPVPGGGIAGFGPAPEASREACA